MRLLFAAAAVPLHLASARAQPDRVQRMAKAVLENVAEAKDFTDALAVSFVTAPNGRTAIDPAEDPTHEELRKRGVDVQVRVDVGPPEASLLVWIVKAKRPPKGTVLVLHGISCTRENSLGRGRALSAAGYHAVLPDLRGHGRSTGKWLPYGVVDSRDMVQALDALLGKGLIQEPIGVFGISYGAATAHQLAARDPRIRAVVSYATFSTLRNVAPIYARNYLPFLLPMLTPEKTQRVVTRAGEMAGFDPDEASPLKAIQSHRTPTLLLHGAEDWNIPLCHSEALHATAPGHSRLAPIEGATHTRFPGRALQEEAIAWFERHLVCGDGPG